MRDDAGAQKLLSRLRQGRGSIQVTRTPTSGVFESPANLASEIQVLPPDQTSVEFELMVRHPVAYPALAPLDWYRDTTAPSRQSDLDGRNAENTVEDAMLYDSRLARVHFADWTSVDVSGYEAALAVSNYLEVDHALLSFFDADLFLTDLVQGEGDFCSSLLVNALLGWAMLGVSNDDARRAESADEAYEVALQQLERGSVSQSSVTLAAIALLSLTAMFKGHGERSRLLLHQSLLLGQNMRLLAEYGSDVNDVSSHYDSGDDIKAKATAAWGLFSFATLHSLHCQKNELGHLLRPRLPLPEPEVSGLPSSSVRVTHHVSRLWDIVHVIARHYYKEGGMTSEEVPVAFVSTTLRQLLLWAHELPIPLVRGNRSPQSVAILHTYLHASILTLLHPLVVRRDPSPVVDGESQVRSAATVYAASVQQMNHIMDVYQARFRSPNASVYWHTGLLFAANAAVHAAGTPVIRQHHFQRAVRGYEDLYRRYPVMMPIVKGLMAVAVETGLVAGPEAVAHVNRLAGKTERPAGSEPTEACFVVDLELAMRHRGLAHVDSLARRFDDIAMFDEFIRDEDGG